MFELEFEKEEKNGARYLIKQAEKRFGSKNKIGQYLGVSSTSVYKWFYEENRMSEKWKQKLKELLDCH